MIKPMLSGHCATPSTADPEFSHNRCAMQGAGNKARPSKEFQPCPCPCHYEDLPRYECGECEGVLVETLIENDDKKDVDEDGNLYPVYLHVQVNDDETIRFVLGQECP